MSLQILFSAALLAVLGPSGFAGAVERPNVVLVLADDLGAGDLGCYSPASKVPTPHLDRLAREGVRFTDAHSPSAVCTPTRYGVLTGRYCWRSRLKSGVLWGRSTALIEPGRATLASFLKAEGYHTACIGKWHLGLGAGAQTDYAQPLRPGPLEAGFDTFFGIPASLDMPPYLYVRDDRPEVAATGEVEGSAHRRQGGGGFWRKGPIAPGFEFEGVLPRLAGEAVAYVEARAGAEDPQPFFLYLPLSAPHTPWVPAPEFRGKSGAGYYGDFAHQVDHVVGELLAALERTGLARDTLVVVTSDNGAHWPVADIERYGHDPHQGRRGQKADIWEGGHRVPLVARWPDRIPTGAVRDDLVCLTDFFATLAALLELELPEDAAEDSFDFSAALRGKERAGGARSTIVHHSLDGVFAVRSGRWKLILGRGSGGFTAPKSIEPQAGEPAGQLYDLVADPAETANRYQEETAVVAELTALLGHLKAAGKSRGVE